MRTAAVRRTTGTRRFSSESQRKAVFAHIAEQHQGLVRKEAYRTARRLGQPQLQEDLIQAGNIGLLQYARRYNPQRGAFSTGATQAIRSKIMREVQRSKTVRVPEKKVGKLARKGPLPSTVGLSEFTGGVTSGGIDQAEARADVASLMKKLSAREQKVIRMRHLEGMTIHQTAKKLRVSGPQISKIESRALKTLRRHYS